MSAPLWQQIRSALVSDIGEQRYGPGDRLPPEAALATRFGVNRHTVRRALAAMAEDGLVHARRGAGVFVTGTQIAYRLGRHTRLTRTLAEAGHAGSRQILRVETLPAADAERAALALPDGAGVHVLESISFADGVPIAHARAVLPAAGLPDLPEHFRTLGSITGALAACGVTDYQRRSTRLTAERATAETARHLRLPEGAPVLRTQSINETPDGAPIEHGQTWFASDRVELVVDDQSFR